MKELEEMAYDDVFELQDELYNLEDEIESRK